jgi:hypothetical protein
MTELKTLKDIRGTEELLERERGETYYKNLRQEAIKWIKALTIPYPYDEEVGCFLGCGCCGSGELVINFIKHFFNITEEELK